ncbi:MAG: hypothetical protein WD928_16475 [Gammaproteobacteria bacterium]
MISVRFPKPAVLATAILLGAGTTVPVMTNSQAQDLDLDVIFNCSTDGPLGEQTPEQCLESRSVLLNSCTACHTFVPIVKAQKSEEAWNSTLSVHRSRVPDLTDEQFEALRAFLITHFNETLPPPVLPPALEALGAGLPA